MDTNAMRQVRGGATFDAWQTYEPNCTDETWAQGCTNDQCTYTCTMPTDSAGVECGETIGIECGPSYEGCPSYGGGCTGETLHPACHTQGCAPQTLNVCHFTI